MVSWKDQPKSHRRRVGKGSYALKRRRTIALDNLLKIKDPDKRELAEIETLQKRTARG